MNLDDNVSVFGMLYIMNNQKHYWLYVLKLEQSKYYVGITAKTPEKRYQEHKNGYMAAQWTKNYKPIALFDKKDLGMKTLSEAEEYENKIVRTYMNKKGFNNVRGGDLSHNDEYHKRFGWYVTKNSWEDVTIVVLLILVIIGLLIKIFFFK